MNQQMAAVRGTSPAQASSPEVSASEIIQVGDRLEVYVLEDESFNGVYIVRDGGHIIFPKVGRVRVSGMSLSAAEAAVKNAFQINILRVATVIMERRSRPSVATPGAPASETAPQMVTVFMSGAVTRQGPVQIPYINNRPPTAYQAVIAGGGFSQFANKKKASILRQLANGQSTNIPVDFDSISKGLGQDVILQDGDIVNIPQRTFGLAF